MSISTLLIAPLVMLGISTSASATDVATSADAFAEKVEARHRGALVASRLVELMKAKTIPNDVRTMLLDKTMGDDKAFAKSLVVHWKAFNDKNIHAEFDEIVVTNDAGVEVFRMKPALQAGTFLINGREWKRPEAGSVEKSLRTFLADTNKNTALRTQAIETPALFARITSTLVSFAQAEEHATQTNMAGIFLPSVGYIASEPNINAWAVNQSLSANQSSMTLWFKAKLGMPANEIRCSENASASSVMKIADEEIPFESRADGTVILQLKSSKRTVLVKPWASVQGDEVKTGMKTEKGKRSKLRKDEMDKYRTEARYAYYRGSDHSSMEQMAFQACSEPTCTRLDDHPTLALRPFLSTPNSKAHGDAVMWRPKDGAAKISASITSAETPFGKQYSLEPGPEGLSGRDLKDASKLMSEARRVDEQRDRVQAITSAIQAIQPLGACCSSSKCRARLADVGTNMIPAAGSGKTTK